MNDETEVPNVYWNHVAESPFWISRTDEERIESHVGFVQAMQHFWLDIGQPSTRLIWDATGRLLIWQQCGSHAGLAMTKEVADWCFAVLPPEVTATFQWIPGFFRAMNNQEDY